MNCSLYIAGRILLKGDNITLIQQVQWQWPLWTVIEGCGQQSDSLLLIPWCKESIQQTFCNCCVPDILFFIIVELLDLLKPCIENTCHVYIHIHKKNYVHVYQMINGKIIAQAWRGSPLKFWSLCFHHSLSWSYCNTRTYFPLRHKLFKIFPLSFLI